MWWTHICHSVADPHVKGNQVTHCVVDLQVKEIKTMNVFESYGCLTENKSLKSALTVHSAQLR